MERAIGVNDKAVSAIYKVDVLSTMYALKLVWNELRENVAKHCLHYAKLFSKS